MLRPMLGAVPGCRRYRAVPERERESAIFAAVAAAAVLLQLPTEDTPPTNSTPPKFQISTTASIGKYDSWEIGCQTPLWTFWEPVLGVSVGKCGHFFVRDFLIVCAAV